MKSNAPHATSAKPRRRDFYRTIVISNDGAIVQDDSWKEKVTAGVTGRKLQNELKQLGLQAIRVFQQDKYLEKYQEHRGAIKESTIKEREELITQAFVEAGATPNKRVANALRMLIPVFQDASPKKVATSFRNIVRIVSQLTETEETSQTTIQ